MIGNTLLNTNSHEIRHFSGSVLNYANKISLLNFTNTSFNLASIGIPLGKEVLLDYELFHHIDFLPDYAYEGWLKMGFIINNINEMSLIDKNNARANYVFGNDHIPLRLELHYVAGHSIRANTLMGRWQMRFILNSNTPYYQDYRPGHLYARWRWERDFSTQYARKNFNFYFN